MKKIHHWFLASIALIGLVVTSSLYTQAQQTAQGEIQLEVTAGNSCCVYGTSVVFGEKDISFGITEFTGDFLSYHGTTSRWCRDLLGTETWRVMYIGMSGDMENANWNKISSGNVKISYDQTQLVWWNCEYVFNSWVDLPLSSAVKLVEKTNTPTNYGKICELGTTNVQLKVVTNTGQAPWNYIGTLVIDLPSFVSSTCDGLLEGTFYDAETDGLTYVGNMWSAGITSNSGTFSYRPGEEIAFKIGNVTLGSPVIPAANGSVFVTDLFGLARTEVTNPNVVEVATLLQWLDTDSNPDNGIAISWNLAAAFTESGNVTGLDVSAKLTSLSLPVRDIEEVVQHLENTAVNRLEENVNVQYSSVKLGTGYGDKYPSSIITDKNWNTYIAWHFTLDINLWWTILTATWSDIFVAKIDKNGNWSEIVQAKANSITNWVYAQGMAIDWSGNKYIVGYWGWAMFGSLPLTETGSFVAKINTSGSRERVESVDRNLSDGQDFASSIAVDSLGNTYIIWAREWSTIIVIKKISSTGTILWTKNIPANPYFYNSQYGIDVDSGGNVYIAGNFGSGELTFWSTTLVKTWDQYNAAFDIFVAKMDTDGNWLWAKQSYGYRNEAHSIKVDEYGNSYVVGTYNGNYDATWVITFWTTTLTGVNLSEWGVFAAKLDSEWNVQWMKWVQWWLGYPSNTVDYDASSQSVYVLWGYQSNNINLWSIVLSWSGEYKIFIGKLDTDWNRIDAYKAWAIQKMSVYRGNISLLWVFSQNLRLKDKNWNIISTFVPDGTNLVFQRIPSRNKNYYLEVDFAY